MASKPPKIGYFLACEEFTPAQLIEQAKMAEAAGFEALWISDHFHPWNDEQGQSPFVWAVIGALSQVTSLPVTTAVTCPTFRIHPAIIAQAAATAQVMLEGRFRLGVGSGEALNEHILGDPWPPAPVRLEMLEEAIQVMRLLWEGGSKSFYGKYYQVENARIYTLPDTPPPVYVSGFGRRSVELAGRVGDGFLTTMPDADAIRRFRDAGGGDKPTQAGMKVCWAPDEDQAVKTVRRLWPNEYLPGELGQILPTPRHVEQASQLVTEDMIRESTACGPDPDRHVRTLKQYVAAGFDEVYVGQIGPEQEGFFEFYRDQVLPRVRAA
ncbi:LLM class F420-dependent oxidoreductase [Carbonactinospora thermoautotrophica]|uniref:LLM class F420-dependent oxidoreductase n=1 Tax=Carbonactinospora thermoautotrophica TaxID=1469144 RepID=UPI002271A0F1|nr:LLM class F420-dependent oxidoreductase [Carbonactinospora thermoautotrophica]MCX9193306.1 LLM class F420-dependent oxidoreductase [Carbonactinospora thermoautotrophica]